jgi:signal peptidase I
MGKNNKKRIKPKKLKFYQIIIILSIIMLVFFIILDPIGLRNCIMNKHYMYMTELQGKSMEPFLHDGDIGLVMIKNSPNYDLRIGDVAVFYYESEDVVVGHRVIAITDGYIMTKGDNNVYLDPPIESEYVIGELVGTIPKYNTVKIWFVAEILGENFSSN